MMTSRSPLLIYTVAIGVLTAALAGWYLGRLTGQVSARIAPGAGSMVADSPWRYPSEVGSAEATWLDRARLASSGPLGLDASEAIYFIAHHDSDGHPLQGGCRYRVRGADFGARWWSLTLYDAVTFDFVETHNNKASYTSLDLVTGAALEWSVIVAPFAQGQEWLPSPEDRQQTLELLLRIYNPSADLRKRLPNIELPVIERQSC
jgi:hypothetical protein